MQQAAAAGAQLRPLHALQPLQGGQLRGVHARQVLQPQRNRLSPAAAAAVAAAANVLFRRRLSVRLRGCLPGIWGVLRRRCGNVGRRPAGAGAVDQRAGTVKE